MHTQLTIPQRFWSKVHVLPNGCWIWTAATSHRGYGLFRVGSRSDSSRKSIHAHRFAYECLVGTIPLGLQSDHLCRNRACVNPSHIELVTAQENAQRGLNGRLKTHCAQGHPFNKTNTYRNQRGWRKCRTCNRERMRASRV